MKKGLGRGIDALFSDMGLEQPSADEQKVQELPIMDVDPNPDQPRKAFDGEMLEQLASSIREIGLIQPICVYPNGQRYTIIAGERRWRAAKLAGLTKIPALVRDLDRVQRMEVALVENIQRADLNPIETALAIHELMEECGLTQDAVSKRIGRSRSAVANLLRLLNLPDSVIELVKSGQLNEGHARTLVSLEKDEDKERLAKHFIEQALSVRQAEETVNAFKKGEPLPEFVHKKGQRPVKKAEKPVNLGLQAVEEVARNAFGTKVQVQGTEKKGKIIIHYFNREDLERIYTLMGGQEE